ncbi:MAG: agmatine deiminase [Oceanospirillaceae bacterium]|nr:agmatine deiminase [Oceanospirillaceae bacterium]
MSSEKLESLPFDDGFYMPSENHPHEAIWMAWPERCDNWRLGAKPAQAVFVELAKAIAATTPVYMICSASQYQNAKAQLGDAATVIEMSTNDAWLRDTGPSCLLNKDASERRHLDWIFNAWGGLECGLYFPWDKDDQVAAKIAEIYGEERYRVPMILEGGAIHVDGDGTLYTTEECVFNLGRNSTMSKSEAEAIFRQYLGIEKVIWLPRGLYNDETNGHIDELMHVVSPGKVLLTWCDDPEDPQHETSREALSVLEKTTDAKGRTIEVIKMPMPGPLYITKEEASGIDLAADSSTSHMDREENTRLAASYTNFLITNGQLIYPKFNVPTDDEAQHILAQCFPEHRLTGVATREVLLGGGNIHCITQQIPKRAR